MSELKNSKNHDVVKKVALLSMNSKTSSLIRKQGLALLLNPVNDEYVEKPLFVRVFLNRLKYSRKHAIIKGITSFKLLGANDPMLKIYLQGNDVSDLNSDWNIVGNDVKGAIKEFKKRRNIHD